MRHLDIMLSEHAFDSVKERRLFSIELGSPIEIPATLGLSESNFVCLLAWDSLGATTEQISCLAEVLLREGASYFVCWGPGCERVHDIIDEVVSHPDADYGVPINSCIMTTWHDSEPLAEALLFFLVNSWPDDHYQDSTDVGLAISVGSPEWAAEITSALSNPRAFIGRG